jgi:hypothetical protein
MKLPRLYADAAGESHSDEVAVELAPVPFAPPAPPVELSPPLAATRCFFLGLPPGWYGDWHPAPHRQLCCVLTGAVELQTSDGEVRVFRPGDAFLTEDTTGRGHVLRTAGSGDVLAAIVQLADA